MLEVRQADGQSLFIEVLINSTSHYLPKYLPLTSYYLPLATLRAFSWVDYLFTIRIDYNKDHIIHADTLKAKVDRFNIRVLKLYG